MAYERVNWENLPSTKTPVNADNLNKLNDVIDSAISSIEVGGRNLLTESSLLSAPTKNANWSESTLNSVTSHSFTNEGLKVITPQKSNPNSGSVIVVSNANNLIKAGEILTFSIDIKGKASNGHIYGFFRGNGNDHWDNHVNIVSSTATTSEDWHRYNGSFTMPNTGTKDLSFYIDLGQGSNEVTTRIYKNAKLERGNIATDWTPAPEDVNNTYSTDEIRIGTWIDGKPIYRKTIKFIGDITNETSIKHNIDNFGTLINCGGSIIFFNKKHPFPVIYPSDMVKFGGGVYSVSDTTIIVEIGTEIIKTANPSNLIIILEYTKTTD